MSATRGIVNRLGSYGVKVISIRESWTKVDGLLREGCLCLSWPRVARIESERRSERTRVGLARAVAEGKLFWEATRE